MTPFTFQYKDAEEEVCKGKVIKFVGGDPMEAEIEINGWTFHVIVGTQWYGITYAYQTGVSEANWQI